jgi:type I restriction enzyme, S subunit
MSEWRSVHLGEVTELVTKGTTPPTIGKGFTNQGINYIKSDSVVYEGRINKKLFLFISPEMHIKLKRSHLKENDILFSMAGAFLGKSGLVTVDMLPANTNQALAIIRLKKEIAVPRFVQYFLRQRSTVEFVNNMSGQSA